MYESAAIVEDENGDSEIEFVNESSEDEKNEVVLRKYRA